MRKRVGVHLTMTTTARRLFREMPSMTREIWRIVPSAPQFLASSGGRIMVAPHEMPMPHGGLRQIGGVPRYGVWQKQGAGGRFIIRNRGKTYRVAPLVCEAFHGPKPFPLAVCMHLDENSRNNVPANLRWGSQKENLNAPGFLEYCSSRIGSSSPRSKWAARRERMSEGAL